MTENLIAVLNEQTGLGFFYFKRPDTEPTLYVALDQGVFTERHFWTMERDSYDLAETMQTFKEIMRASLEKEPGSVYTVNKTKANLFALDPGHPEPALLKGYVLGQDAPSFFKVVDRRGRTALVELADLEACNRKLQSLQLMDRMMPRSKTQGRKDREQSEFVRRLKTQIERDKVGREIEDVSRDAAGWGDWA